MASASPSYPFLPDATEPVAGPSRTAPSYHAEGSLTTPSSIPSTTTGPYPNLMPVVVDHQADLAPPQHPMLHAKRFGGGRRGKAPEKRQRTGASAGMVFEGYPDCTNIGNTAMSCFPASNTTLVQSQWSKFIWNPNWPDFVAATRVDVYLYNAGSELIAKNWTSVENTQGQVPIEPDDDWWESIPSAQEIGIGQNMSHPYFFVIVPAGQSLSGGESHQATFAAIQTSPPSSILAAMTSASLASASALSLSSARAASTSSSSASAASSNASLQGDQQDSGSSFPKWAIAVIAILGALFILAFVLLLFFFRRRNREKSRRRAHERERTQSHTPDMQKEPVDSLGGSAAPLMQAASVRPDSSARTESPMTFTATRTRSRDGAESTKSSQGPFSAPEAAALADAFRQAMRKPDFHSELPEENSSPESATTPTGGVPSAILKESLRSETSGSIRTVDDRKGYRVHPGDA